MRLSVLIPVYNERATVLQVVALVCAALPDVEKEVVLVDECSSDGTRALLQKSFDGKAGCYKSITVDAGGSLQLAVEGNGAGSSSFRLLLHEKNQGKGAALRSAMGVASGDVIVIQDADLEYDPQDWTLMYDLIGTRKIADVVYGSRFYGRPHRSLF